MKTPSNELEPTREIPIKQLPQCHCGRQQTGNWTGGTESHWMIDKPEGPDQKEAGLIEYVCLSCNRRHRLRGKKLYEVLTDGTERAYMREGQYGRWFSCH